MDPVRIIHLPEIKSALSSLDLTASIEEGFAAYSAGEAVVPPVGELLLEKGEVHIKYGFIQGDPYYVVKIASGFYENPELGLASSNGLMLLFRQATGQLVSVLLDEGWLTDTRTAVAGAIAARYLSPSAVSRIGILGSGVQARLQLSHLSGVTRCRRALAWGRDPVRLRQYREDMEKQGFSVSTTHDSAEVAAACNLIVTTTPSTSPLLSWKDIRPGTHITAVGSDTPEKQELDSRILERADLVVGDSLPQCMLRGEIFQAIQSGVLTEDRLTELGNIVRGQARGRTSERQVTVADLTGVAVQDIKIAAAVYDNAAS